MKKIIISTLTIFLLFLVTNVSSGEDLLLFFSWERCGPCHKMKDRVWPNKLVQEEVSNFTFYEVVLDNDPFSVMQWNVTAYPTTILAKKEGNSVREVRRVVGYQSASELLRFLRKK